MKVKIFCMGVYAGGARTDDMPSTEKAIQAFLDKEVKEVISVTQSSVKENKIIICIFYR